MLSIGTKVYGNYKISSMPYKNKDDTYTDIATYWYGVDCTTYFDRITSEWYIISQ